MSAGVGYSYHGLPPPPLEFLWDHHAPHMNALSIRKAASRSGLEEPEYLMPRNDHDISLASYGPSKTEDH